MIRQLVLAAVALTATMGFAWAQVDVNKADAAALDKVQGVGPTTSKAILDARGKGGEFKDWADFQKRVKGVSDKRAANLSKAGLQVNGQPKPAAAEDKTGGGKADGAKARPAPKARPDATKPASPANTAPAAAAATA